MFLLFAPSLPFFFVFRERFRFVHRGYVYLVDNDYGWVPRELASVRLQYQPINQSNSFIISD